MTVRELLARTDSAEITEWIAYSRLEPFGPLVEDFRAGIVAATVGNHGYTRPDKPYKPADFMPYLKREDTGPILLADADKQSALILSQVFGRQ